jgi:3-oxoacyl-[acyl-carrier protein] reductase
MDLGIGGRTAIVCAASRGLGRACAFSLAEAGVTLTIVARREDVLEETAAEIRAVTGVDVTVVAADMPS